MTRLAKSLLAIFLSAFPALLWAQAYPAATPRPILERLNAEVNKVINAPEVREAWGKQGAMPMGMSIAQFDMFLREEIVKWAPVVKATGMKVD